MPNPDNVKALYEELKKSYEIGSEEDFIKYLSDDKNREALRKELEKDYDVGDIEAFTSYLGFGTGPEAYAQYMAQRSGGEGVAQVEQPKSATPVAGATAGAVRRPYHPIQRSWRESAMPEDVRERFSEQKPQTVQQQQPTQQEQPLGPEKFQKSVEMQIAAGSMQGFTQKTDAMLKGNKPFGGREDALAPARQARVEEEFSERFENRLEDVREKMRQDNSGVRKAWENANMRASSEWRFGRPVSNEAARLKHHDIDRMADEAWELMDDGVKTRAIRDVVQVLHETYPEMGYGEAWSNAEKIVRGESDKQMYEMAVQQNAPRNWGEYLLEKVNSGTVGSVLEGWARSKAGTTGDLRAREEALEQYGKGHRLLDIGGSVLTIGIDPLTYIGGGLSGALVKGIGGKAVTRMAMETVLGKAATGMVAGGANLAVFEAGGEAAEQMKWGGKRSYNEATGQIEIGDYRWGDVASAAGRGVLLGMGTGVAGQLIGNVGDKLYKGVGSTVGKAAVRGGQTLTSIAAEGTVFALPEFMSGEGDWDTWLNSVEMMAGFKLSHGIKTIPQTYETLKKKPESRVGFETRLRTLLDGQPKMALTNQERAELKRGGYSDLTKLVDGYKRASMEQRNAIETRQPIILEPDANGEVPYNRFLELMEDKSISEAARAKMHYYVSGHKLPQTAVVGSTITEHSDADGNIEGYTVEALGKDSEVILSKRFKSKKEAEVELARINRQAELNGIAMVERSYDRYGDAVREGEALSAVSELTGMTREELSELMKRDPKTLDDVDKTIVERIKIEYTNRAEQHSSVGKKVEIQEEYLVDIDDALSKEPNRRSEQERQAIEEYLRRMLGEGGEFVSQNGKNYLPLQTEKTQGDNSYGSDKENDIASEDSRSTSGQRPDGSGIREGRAERAQRSSDGIDIEPLQEGLASAQGGDYGGSERDIQQAYGHQIIESAKKNGVYVDPSAFKGFGVLLRKPSGESDVYINEQEGRVVKIKDPFAKMPMKGHATGDVLYEHIVHNILFPDTPYRLLGISEQNGEMRLVLEQEFFGNDYKPATQEQIDKYMTEVLGLEKEGKYWYGNDILSITDVVGGSDNVIVGVDGRLHFIDPIIKFKVPGKDVVRILDGVAGKSWEDAAYDRGYNADKDSRIKIAMDYRIEPSDEHRAAVEGVEQRIRDDAEEEAVVRRQELEKKTHGVDGNVHPATLKEVDAEGNPKEVYIVDGDFMMDAEGNISGDETIVVYDPLEGKNRFVSPMEIESLGAVTTAEQETQAIEAEKEARIEMETKESQGQIVPGMRFPMADGVQGTIISIEGDEIVYQRDDGVQGTMPLEETQALVDTALMEEYRKRYGTGRQGGQPSAADQMVEGVPERYEPKMRVRMTGDDGQEHEAVVVGAVRLDKGRYVPDENGQLIEYYVDGDPEDVRHDYKGDLDLKVAGYMPVAGEESAMPLQGKEEENTGQQASTVAGEEAERSEEAERPEEALYEQVKGEYGEDAREKVENTVKIKAKRVEDTKKALDKAREELKKTEFGSQAEATAREKRDKAQKAYDAAVGDHELWKAVKHEKDQEVLAEQAAKDAAMEAEKARRRAELEAARERDRQAYAAEVARRKAEREKELEILNQIREEQSEADIDFPIENDEEAMREMNDLEPRTLEEVAAHMLADTTGKYKIDPELIREHTGYSTADLRKFPFVFAKGGMSPEAFGEKVEQIARESNVPFNDGDTNLGFDALLNVMGEVGSLSDLKNYIKENRRINAERLHNLNIQREAAARAEDRWVAQHGGMTREEYTSYINWMEDAVEQGKTALTDEEYNQLFNTDYDRTAETNDERGDERGAEKGSADESEAGQAGVAADDTRGDGEEGAEGRDGEGESAHQEKPELTEEKRALQEKLIGWLTDENIEWAEGKTLDEVTEHFGNEPEPIAVMPAIVKKNVPSLSTDYLYSGKGYMIDHHANHHPELDISEYINIQTILDSYDDIKDLSDGGNLKIAFVKKLDKGYAVVVELSKENDKIVLHKTFFYRDSNGKRVPYKTKPSILEKWSEDGSTSISPVDASQQPADTENISALDQLSGGKDTNNSETSQINNVTASIAAAEAEVNTEPTEGQKKAGNYKMGHVKVDGYDITIENPKGSMRRGTDPSGKAWEQEMHNTYGYIKGTVGFDKDHIDIFLSDDPTQGNVYVVDQVKEDGTFDEHKVLYGFGSVEEARQAYLANYEEGWQGLGAITPVSKEEFKKWIESSHRKTKPFSEYKSVETLGDVQLDRGVAGTYGGPVTVSAMASQGKEEEKAGKEAKTAADVEAGGAVVDKLEEMGVEVSTDMSEMRRVRKQAEQDQSEAGKLHELRKRDGSSYGFAYRGKLYLDPRKIDAELPLHEYGHLWTEAYRILNPEGWKDVVETIKQDTYGWEFVKQLYPDLTTDSEIADEVIATFSGRNGAAKLRAELERMSAKNPDYKSRWGNIYNNIVKAIRDFWKAVGDFLGIKYNSPEQVYDQVLKDFASGMNPRERVEEYLRERDDTYVHVAESGDVAKATEIFNQALSEEVGNGMTPFVAVGKYAEVRDLAKKVKTRDPKVIQQVAEMMAPIIPDNAVLVPVPSHGGRATDMLDLAEAIAKIKGVPVADVLESAPRASQYETKRESGQPITADQMGIVMNGELPDGRIPVLIDNVVDSGNTAEACMKAIGKGIVATLGDSVDQYRHAVTLKSASPIVRDRNGKVVPLSKRFDLSGSRAIGKVQMQKVDESRAAEVATEAEKAARKLLDGVMKRIFGKDYSTTVKGGQQVIDEANGESIALNKAQKRALEAASVAENQQHHPAVTSNADGAKIQKNLDRLAEKYEKVSNRRKNFLEEVAEVLKAEHKGSGSRYATFETESGNVVTIRLADHNAKVKNFDYSHHYNGISIVVTSAPNEGLKEKDKSKAHIVEFYYNEHKLRNEYGHPLAEIVRSIKEALITGEYADPTGIAEREEVNAEQIRYHGAAPVFYSNAMRAVEGIKQEKATAEQWLAMIQKAGGLKAGEDKWIGLSEWLQERAADRNRSTVTKQEVLDFIRSNQIEIEEVNYGDALFSPRSKVNFESDIERARENGESDESVMKAWDREFGTKMVEAYKNGEFTINENGKVVYNGQLMMPINSTRLYYTTKGLQNKREIALVVPTVESWNENDTTHFGDAGGGRAVAWVRFGETTDKDGKRVLVIDEIQSNRHQEGREKGYSTLSARQATSKFVNAERRRAEAARQHSEDWEIYVNSEEYQSLLREVQQAEEEMHKAEKSVPDAPFEKNWHEVCMKRMLRYAAENGYDKVAWTTGEQQAERYNIGDVIKDISVGPAYDPLTGKVLEGKYDVFPHDYNNMILIIEGGIGVLTREQVLSVYGKDLGQRMMDAADKDPDTVISGDGLRIGGEGMKGFYDQILPRFMDKYGKKWGVKTGEVELPGIGDSRNRLSNGETGLVMHSVDVTEEMRRSVLEGQPMFHKVFHGSGADFEAFDSRHMGEGEGAQAYGWGHYTTEVEGIGKMYAGNADGHVVYNGRKWSYYDGINESRALDFAVKATIAARGNKEKAVAIIEKNKASSMYPQFNQSLEEAKDLVNNGALEYVETHTPVLYEVEIPDDIENVRKSDAKWEQGLAYFAKNKLTMYDSSLGLGDAGEVLKACGLPSDSDLYIQAKTLKKHLKKHGLTEDDIKELPSALRDPMLVYEWGTKAKSLIVVTELSASDGRKITAAIKLERNGKRAEVNEITSIHGKEERRMLSEFVDEMNKKVHGGLEHTIKYIKDKEKVLDWLGLVPPQGTASLTEQELSVAKILNNFENPQIDEKKYGEYLEWNKALNEDQAKEIASKLYDEILRTDKDGEYADSRAQAKLKEELSQVFRGDNMGSYIYHTCESYLGNAKAASEFLHNSGFTGIKYPTNYSRGGNTDGTSNYVVFDDGDLKIVDKVKFFRTKNGTAYGFTVDGKIYIDPRIATSETRVHEYAHLWAQALRSANPKAWAKLKAEMRQEKEVMDYVKRLYPELKTEDELMEEVFTHYAGRRGAERLVEDMRESMAKEPDLVEKARIATVFHKLREMLDKFWSMARDLFAGNNSRLAEMKAEDFADMMMADLMHEVDPRKVANSRNADIRFQKTGEEVSPAAKERRLLNDKEKNNARTKLENTKPIVAGVGVIKSTDTMSARNAAEQWAGIHLKEPLEYGTEAGVVVFDKTSVKDSLAHGYSQAKLDAIPTIPEGFKNATYLGSLEEVGGSERNKTIEHYFAYPIDYNGELCYVFCRAKEDVNKNRLYVHEVFIADKIKSNALQTAAGKESEPRRGIALYRNILSDILGAKVQQNSDTAKNNLQEALNNRDINISRQAFKDILANSGLRFSRNFSYKNGSDYYSFSLRDKNDNYEIIRVRIADHPKPTEQRGVYIEGKNDFRNYKDAYDYLTKYFDLRDKTAQIEEKRKELESQVKEVEHNGEVVYQIGSGGLFTTAEAAVDNRMNTDVIPRLTGQLKDRLVDGNDINEWGFDDGTTNAYKNTKNNRKLLDPVTYDDAVDNAEEGTKPLSKRFDSRKDDIRFQKAGAEDITSEENIAHGLDALQQLADGAEEVRNAMKRKDLSQYGGDENITFYFGKEGDASKDYKKGYGIAHIGAKHGKDAIIRAINIIANGQFERYVPGNKTVVLTDGEYETVLALTRFGNKETWLFNGWKKKENTGDNGEVSTASVSTQNSPTFSRADLGAVVSAAKVQTKSDTAKNKSQNAERKEKRRGVYTTKSGAQLTMMSLFEGDPTGVRLRKLKEGETCHVERRYEESRQFSFMGKEKIESMDDVAYIFKQLETAAVENTFLAMVKDGRPTVIHIGMGGYASSPADARQALAAYMDMKPDAVYFVHNHPSGSLRASRDDMNTLQRMRNMFGADVVQDGIIIDTVSGKYCTFGYGGSSEASMPEVNGGDVPVKTYEFSKQVFSPEWKPQEAFKMTDTGKVAEFVSSHRLGEHQKMSLIVTNTQGQVVGNFFLPWTMLSDIENNAEAVREMSNYVNLAGGTAGILYGNYEYDSYTDKNALRRLADGMNMMGTPLHDVVHLAGEYDYHSARETGVMEPTEGYEMRVSDSTPQSGMERATAIVAELAAKNRDNGKESERRRKRAETNNIIADAISFVTGKDKKEIHRERVEREQERKREARRVYDLILSGQFNDVSLQSINNYINDVTPENEFGRHISERLPQRVVRNVEKKKGIAAVDALFSRVSESAVRPNERTRSEGRRAIERRKNELLKQWAIATGNWHTDIKDFTDDTEPVGEGTDSKVYASRDGQHVIKFSKGKPSGKRFRPDIDNIPLFNSLFHDTAYEILGYGEDDGKFVRILQQPAVDFENSVPLTPTERTEFMEKLGFRPMNSEKTAFTNGEIIVADLQKSNIVRDGDGNIQVIDADVKLHTKDMGGEYNIRPVELELANEQGTSQNAENDGKNAAKGREADSRYVFNPYAPHKTYEESLAASRAAGYTKRQHDAMVERRKKNYAERGQRAKEMAEKLNLGGIVEIRENADGLEERFQGKKGWYNPRTGKITVVLDKHGSMDDILQTILHEGVGHHGLREMFGKHFDDFIDNVYNGATLDVRRRIIDLAKHHGWDYRTGTEEYLAQMAETMDFEKPENRSWWQKVKDFFFDMLHKLGIKGAFAEGSNAISDNELSYILWRSYQNLVNPGRYRSFVDMANDTVMQDKLKVGNFEERQPREAGGEWQEMPMAAEAREGDGIMFRDGDFSERDRVIAADYYERMLSKGSYQFREAMQDSMLGLRKAYEAILGSKNFRIEDVAGNENAYMAENAMSSANNAQQDNYFNRYMKPLLRSISDLVGRDERKRQDLLDYMMAKHGLERNRVFAERDAMEAAKKGADYADELQKNRGRDYAGLTALTGEADVVNAEGMAQKMVDDYEKNHDTTALWDAVNTATKVTLAKMYMGGLMSRENYEQVRDMFSYYIPLRGFDETTSDEVYGYLTSKNGLLGGSILKHAEGRSSKADDPIANIALMADAAIRQSNRNMMKQKFLTFVQNHPSDLVSVNKLWLQYDAASDEWVPVFADIESSDTPDEVERKVEAFEQHMEQLAANEPDKYKSGSDAVNIPYRVMKSDMREHQVLVKRGGETFVLTINGNPRAAQALNGLTNPDVETGGVLKNFMKGLEKANHFMSAAYTTRTPDFIVSNFFRDTLYSNCMTWVKESPSYALRFHKNFGKFNPAVMMKLFEKWEYGELDDSKPVEFMFKQFMLHGGETGYTNVKDIEAKKKEVAKALRREGDGMVDLLNILGEQLDILNRSVENVARFAAFITSQEMGRSIERSIYDAKEVSVNFNKKGSGGKMVDATGENWQGKIGSYLSGGGRLLYVFWNAGVQGMTNFGRSFKRHPGKALTAAATMFALGYVIPLLAEAMWSGDDDDKDAYYNLPEYVRRSNICIRVGKQWLTVPLPIEFRAVYGLGELATGVITGKEHYSDSELTRQMVSQVSQILPLDFMEGGGGLHAFVPSAAKPIVEAYSNKGWTGLPIYRESPYDKEWRPNWTKAYKGADKYIVGASKWLSDVTGGDEYIGGAVDINPARLEYILNGYLGGFFKVPNQLAKMAETAFGDREFEWRNMMIANRLLKNGDERTENRKLQNEYFKYKEEYEKTKDRVKNYTRAKEEGVLKYAEKLDFLNNSPEYARYEIFDKYRKTIDNLYKAKKEASGDEGKALEAEYYDIIREMVTAMHSYEDSLREKNK